jgi:hypothetical protein
MLPIARPLRIGFAGGVWGAEANKTFALGTGVVAPHRLRSRGGLATATTDIRYGNGLENEDGGPRIQDGGKGLKGRAGTGSTTKDTKDTKGAREWG